MKKFFIFVILLSNLCIANSQTIEFVQPKKYEVIGYLTQIGIEKTKTIIVLTVERARTWQNYYELELETEIQKMEKDFFDRKLIPVLENSNLDFRFTAEKPDDFENTTRIFELKLISTGQYSNYRQAGVVGADFEKHYVVTLTDFTKPKDPKRLSSSDALWGKSLGWYIGNLLTDNMVSLSSDSVETLNVIHGRGRR